MQKSITTYFINTIICSFFILFFCLGSVYLLPEKGVNILFISNLWKYLLLFSALILVFFALYLYLKSDKKLSYEKQFEKLTLLDLIVTLVPLTPITQYIFHNQDILSLHQSFTVFSFFALMSIVLCALIPIIFSVFAKKAALQISATGFLYTLLSMANFSANNHWHLAGDIIVQIAVLVICIFILFAISKFAQKWFNLAIVIFFIANTGSAILTAGTGDTSNKDISQEISKLPIYTELANKQPAHTNDIILLVYEAYANNQTLKHYGFDNSSQMNYLKNMGFNLYENSYSIAPCTQSSMPATFSAQMQLSPEYNNRMYEHGRKHIASGAIQRTLAQQNYKYVGIFKTDAFFRGISLSDMTYDLYFPPLEHDESALIINAILEGEFRHEAGYDKIDHQTYVNTKRQVLSQKQLSPYLFYTHSTLPGHSQNSGQCLTDETEKYFRGLEIANKEMRGDIEAVIKNNPDAIIVVAGDHGPYLTRNCAFLIRMRNQLGADQVTKHDLQDRYGNLLAIRWPESESAIKYDIQVLQDIFPAIASYLYDDDTIFDKTRAKRETQYAPIVSLGVQIINGKIKGGVDDGKPLY